MKSTLPIALLAGLLACKKAPTLPGVTGTFTTSTVTTLTPSGNIGGRVAVALSDEQAGSSAIKVRLLPGVSLDALCEGRAPRRDLEGGGANFDVTGLTCRWVHADGERTAGLDCPVPQLSAVSLKYDPAAGADRLRVFVGQIQFVFTPATGTTSNCPTLRASSVATDTELRREAGAR